MRPVRVLTLVALGCLLAATLPGVASAAPANDNFASATPLTGTRASRTGDSTNGASTEPGEPAHAGVANGGSIWYAWTPSVSGPVMITTAGSGFDTVMAVYTGTIVSALSTVVSNDDESGTNLLTSRVHFDATGGTTYWIAVAGYGGDTGPVSIRLFQGPASTTRISLSSAGAQINNDSWITGYDDNANPGNSPVLDSDGSVLAFANASNTVTTTPPDAGGDEDVYVRDILGGTTTRVSIDTTGLDTNSDSWDPAIDGSGNLVAFTSDATDLVGTDGNGQADIFLRNISGATTTKITNDTVGGGTNDWSQNPTISSDGNVIAYESWATDLTTPAGNGNLHIYVRNLTGGTTTLVSQQASPSTTQGNNASWDPALDADGSVVAFESNANNLLGAGADTNGSTDVFVRDMVTGAITRASVDSNETPANDDSRNPSVSADGTKVVFESDASNLIASDSNFATDIFVRDLAAGTTERISVRANGIQQIQGKGNSTHPVIDPAGRYVLFESSADNLVVGDTNGSSDIFLHDLVTHVTSRVSVQTGGDQANNVSEFPAISGDGDLAWTYWGNDLAAGDTNNSDDIYMRTIGFQVDALIKAPAESSYSGDGVYQASASGAQAKTIKAAKGSTQNIGVQVENDGSVSDAFTVAGCAKKSGFSVKYTVGGDDQTAAITAGTYNPGAIPPGDSKTIQLSVKLSKKATGSLACVVTATSATDPTKVDQVKATVKALKTAV